MWPWWMPRVPRWVGAHKFGFVCPYQVGGQAPCMSVCALHAWLGLPSCTPAQVPSTVVSNTLPGVSGSATSSVAFVASLPALGYTTYFVSNASEEGEVAEVPKVVQAVAPGTAAHLRGAAEEPQQDVVVSNGKGCPSPSTPLSSCLSNLPLCPCCGCCVHVQVSCP
jgi:hypothetical protein